LPLSIGRGERLVSSSGPWKDPAASPLGLRAGVVEVVGPNVASFLEFLTARPNPGGRRPQVADSPAGELGADVEELLEEASND
jgi:hypothetical protein